MHAERNSHSPALGSTNLPGQWFQCQANGSNVCRVLRFARGCVVRRGDVSFDTPGASSEQDCLERAALDTTLWKCRVNTPALY